MKEELQEQLPRHDDPQQLRRDGDRAPGHGGSRRGGRPTFYDGREQHRARRRPPPHRARLGRHRQARAARAPPVGYYNDPEKTAATFLTIDGERWVVPGDLATVRGGRAHHRLRPRRRLHQQRAARRSSPRRSSRRSRRTRRRATRSSSACPTSAGGSASPPSSQARAGREVTLAATRRALPRPHRRLQGAAAARVVADRAAPERQARLPLGARGRARPDAAWSLSHVHRLHARGEAR